MIVLPAWWPEVLALLEHSGLQAARKHIWHTVREENRGKPRSKAQAAFERYEIHRLFHHARQAHEGTA